MKKILFSLIGLFGIVLPSFAGDGDNFFNINVGAAVKNTLYATVGYEREFGYGHSAEIFMEAGNQWQYPTCHNFWKGYYWDGGMLYKYRVSKGKNSAFKLRGGLEFGSNVRKFAMGFEVGLEYNYTFSNNWEFSLIQRDQFNFIHGDSFRNGLLIGLKIPF